MIELIDSALPTMAAVCFLVIVLALVGRFYRRLPEFLEEPNGRNKLSAKRLGALGVTAATIILLSNGVDIPLELWFFNGWLWGAKTLQRYVEQRGKE